MLQAVFVLWASLQACPSLSPISCLVPPARFWWLSVTSLFLSVFSPTPKMLQSLISVYLAVSVGEFMESLTNQPQLPSKHPRCHMMSLTTP